MVSKGCLDNKGYRKIRYKGSILFCHVVSYLIFNGRIKKGLHIDHICRNRQCINPKRLRLLTPRENILCGEGPSAINNKKTHCIRGHVFDIKNTYVIFKKGKILRRQCRKCRKNSSIKWLLKNRGNQISQVP